VVGVVASRLIDLEALGCGCGRQGGGAGGLGIGVGGVGGVGVAAFAGVLDAETDEWAFYFGQAGPEETLLLGAKDEGGQSAEEVRGFQGLDDGCGDVFVFVIGAWGWRGRVGDPDFDMDVELVGLADGVAGLLGFRALDDDEFGQARCALDGVVVIWADGFDAVLRGGDGCQGLHDGGEDAGFDC